MTVHQLFSFLDLGLVMTELPRNNLHTAGDLFLQAGLTLPFSTTLTTTRSLDAGDVPGLVERTAGLNGLRTSGPRFVRDGLVWEIL